jgi:hypothetical protein
MNFLRFPDEQAWTVAATEAGFLMDDTVTAYTHGHAIDVVGTITRGGEYDEDGKVLVKPTTLPGFHVNFAGELPEGWEEFVVTPAAPYRVFA